MQMETLFCIETVFAGRHSDGGIFRASRIGHWPDTDSLNLPNPNDPNGICFLYYFTADKKLTRTIRN